MPEFGLSKWYLDCVTDAGEVSILYSGAARWGRAFRLNYASLIETTGNAVDARRSLRAAEAPTFLAGSLLWRLKPLRIDGEWHADANPLRATVFSCGSGSVEWECLMPRARARIGHRGGLGYVERLTMTVAPWKLPLRTLRWGRFASPAEWAVWIQWCGEYSRTLVFRNGAESPAVAVDDSRLEFADGSRLALDRSLVIRQGPIGSTVFARMPMIRHTVPGLLLQVTECKWRSRARLERRGAPPVDGWAIHENVQWLE